MQEILDQSPVSEPLLAAETTRRTFIKNFGLSVVGVAIGTGLADMLTPSSSEAQTATDPQANAPSPAEQTANIDNTESQAEKNRADARSANATAAQTRAQTANLPADVAKTRADAASSQADAAKTRAEAASSQADAAKTRADIRDKDKWWNVLADEAPIIAPLGTAAAALIAYLEWNHTRKDTNQKARQDERKSQRQADDTLFTDIQLRLEGHEAKWNGADIQLLAFSEGDKKEYADYTMRIFDLTRTVLRNRPRNQSRSISPQERNVVSSFLTVLEPARRHEKAVRTKQTRLRGGPNVELPILEASGVNMRDTNLLGEDLSRINFSGALFTKAILDGAFVDASRFDGVSFSSIASARGAHFLDCSLTPAQIKALSGHGAQITQTGS